MIFVDGLADRPTFLNVYVRVDQRKKFQDLLLTLSKMNSSKWLDLIENMDHIQYGDKDMSDCDGNSSGRDIT